MEPELSVRSSILEHMFDSEAAGRAVLAILVSSSGQPHFAGMPGERLAEVVAASERLVARAQGLQLAALAELTRRPVFEGGTAQHPAADFVHAVEQTAAEVAPACRWSRVTAEHRVHLAVSLDERLPATLASLREGSIDLSRARAVAEAVEGMTEDTAATVEAKVLTRAAQQTPAQLRACLRRAVLAVDPAGGERRHQLAVGSRRVVLRDLPDGVAELVAPMRADHAEAIYARLSDIARQALSAHRAGLDHPPGQVRPEPDRHVSVHADDPCLDSLRADALVWLTLGEPMPGLPPAAPSPTPDDAAANGPRHEPPGGAAATRRGCAHCGADRPRPLVSVVVPVGTLLGLTEEPGELAGYGPIPATLAREIAADGQWRRVLTDPATGTTVSAETRTYVPPETMAALVRARDGTCRFPGCRQPASRADLDHVLPWPHGSTCPCNLCSLCRFHHLLKTHHGWRTRMDARTDEVTWTSPLGRRYTTRPEGIPKPDASNSAQLRLTRLGLGRRCRSAVVRDSDPDQVQGRSDPPGRCST